MTNQLLVRLCWEKRNSDELLLFVYHLARTHCGKIFGTFKATHWSPEVSYFNKHFPPTQQFSIHATKVFNN